MIDIKTLSESYPICPDCNELFLVKKDGKYTDYKCKCGVLRTS